MCAAGVLDDIVVVGLSGTAAHFDGRRWSRRTTGTNADLLGVARLDDARRIAVGTRGTALVWDNGAWIEEDTGTDVSLRAVWVSGDGTAWAVGDGGTVRRRSPWSPFSFSSTRALGERLPLRGTRRHHPEPIALQAIFGKQHAGDQ